MKKFVNKMKNFWRLQKKNNSGFTLVELIVVIAVLAILAGIAVPAYSGYVEKANKQADMTLISEIEQAITLAGYKGTFTNGEGDYLILSSDGEVQGVTEGSGLEQALIDTFGADYKDVLKLKYDAWGNNGLAMGLGGGQAEAVYNSTYYGVSDQLMGQVKEITDAAWNLLGNDGNATREQMVQMFNGSLSLDAAAQTYGYDSLDEVPDDALPNLLVLTVAADITSKNNNSDHEMAQASGLIQDFALFNGYAATEAGKQAGADGKSFADAYATFVAEIGVEDAELSDVVEAYNKLKAASEADSGFANYSADDQSTIDLNAFSAMMSGLAGAAAMNPEGVTAGLSEADFFTEKLGKDLFDTYIGSVESAVGLDAAASLEMMNTLFAEEGNVAVYYSFLENAVVIGNSLPVGSY